MGSDDLDALPGTLCLIAEQLTAPVSAMHEVISDRAFRFTGPPGRAIQRMHDATAGAVYRAIPLGARAAGQVARSVLGRRLDGPVSEHGAGVLLQAMANAAWGDRMAEGGNARATETTFRRNGEALAPATVASALSGRRTHVVVLFHGLGQTERCWEGPGGLVADLNEDPLFEPLPVRYSTGRPVAETGDEVATLIDDLWQAGAAPGTTLSLVGFSLGGLVARAALAATVRRGLPAGSAIRHIVTIGAPHTGAPLARAARFAAGVLRMTKTTRPLGVFLDGRSTAMKELGRGPDGACVPDSAAVRHHFVAATVTGDPGNPVGALMGDLVVRVGSATAPAAAEDDVAVHGGRWHAHLLADPDVRTQILAWLRSPVG